MAAHCLVRDDNATLNVSFQTANTGNKIKTNQPTKQTKQANKTNKQRKQTNQTNYNLQLHSFHIDLNFGLVATGPAGSNFTAFIDYIYSHMYKHTCLIVWLGRLDAACLLLMAGPDTVMGMAYTV